MTKQPTAAENKRAELRSGGGRLACEVIVGQEQGGDPDRAPEQIAVPDRLRLDVARQAVGAALGRVRAPQAPLLAQEHGLGLAHADGPALAKAEPVQAAGPP